jgi:hypothetical protein
MEQLDAAREELLDDDDRLVGIVKDVKEVEKRLRHKLLPRIAWHLFSSSCPHQRTNCTNGEWYVAVRTSMY